MPPVVNPFFDLIRPSVPRLPRRDWSPRSTVVEGTNAHRDSDDKAITRNMTKFEKKL